ncbi:MAG: LysR family transcriptional regulator [Proteobacteria bacterium]|nr:LysR family transcriptional regulator [Pseudomonadota bacterium]MBI3498618.1 LysR family transcriptional regulator [Pseudomonadota bacterium]
MKATLSQIEAFYWIAQLGSYRAAAAHLNLTQPTVSLRIRSLEHALDIRLFERAGRQVRITADGAAMLPVARRMVDLADQVSAKHANRDPLRGQLRLGAPASFALSCMADLLGALKQQYPELTVALTIDNSVVLRERLNNRELDVAFVVEPKVEPYVRLEPLGVMTHAWVRSPVLALPADVVEPGDLVHCQVLTHPEPSNLTVLVLNWFASAGLEPEHLSTCNDLSVIIRLTAAGEGVSLLPTAIIAAELASGALVTMKARPEIARPHLYLAYQADKIGPRMSTLIAIARRVLSRSTLLASG